MFMFNGVADQKCHYFIMEAMELSMNCGVLLPTCIFTIKSIQYSPKFKGVPVNRSVHEDIVERKNIFE